MPKIIVIGDEEIVLLFGLLGIDGIILENANNFLKEFNKLVNDPTIGMVLISLELPEEITRVLIDFKLNNRRPFIFNLPDVFEPNIEEKNIFFAKIESILKKIVF
ncbi:MAG TPA: V-type ATP synthase subunit F [Candidatus Lokiarchaeia archaeon]